MIKIVIDSAIPFIRGVFENVASVEYHVGDKITSDIVKDADVLIVRTRTKCNRELLHGSKVSLICTATIGFDHIDKHYCELNGITWYSMAGCNSNSVAQYFLAALAYLNLQKCLNFSQLTVGVVGMGNVGSKIVRYCRVIGINVLINDPLIVENQIDKLVTFDELISKSDIITFHVPLQKDGIYPTYHMINNQSFSKVKEGVVLINTSRGEIVNEEDLVQLINNKVIGDIILDVWENEPQINLQLLEKAMISTSHIAGYSADGKRNGTLGSVLKVSQYFGFKDLDKKVSQPLLPVNPIIEVNCEGKSFEVVFSEVILRTYSIDSDSNQLKSNPTNFEHFRNQYPNRREFGSYTLKFHKDINRYIKIFQELGFNTDCYVA